MTMATAVREFYAWEGRAVISVDPGLHTGVAYLCPDGRVLAHEAEWDDAMVAIRDALLAFSGTPTWLVCEAFIISVNTAKKTQAPWSLEGIGVCRFLARRHHASLVVQQPVEAKRWSTNARLKSQGWYVPTPGGHTNDALRHLYLFLSKRGVLTPPAGVI